MSNIVLIGFMGSGKTTVGIRLSYLLRRTFLDTDKLAEKEMGMTISEAFATKGEPYFRDTETSVLKKLIENEDNKIIATGGGLPMRAENAALLKELGMVFYLKASPETIFERTKHDTKRPLLQNDHPLQTIRDLMEERGPKYENAAQYIIEVDRKDFKTVLSEIEKIVREEKS